MGSILNFKPRDNPRKPAGDQPATQATVLMFTGVRYERHAPAEPAAKWTSPGWLSPFQPGPLPQT